MESYVGRFAEISDLPKDEQIRLLEQARYKLAMQSKFIHKWASWFIGSLLVSFLVYCVAIIFLIKISIWVMPVLVGVSVLSTQLLFNRFYSKKLHQCLLTLSHRKNA
jgi:hypothetical protein